MFRQHRSYDLLDSLFGVRRSDGSTHYPGFGGNPGVTMHRGGAYSISGGRAIDYGAQMYEPGQKISMRNYGRVGNELWLTPLDTRVTTRDRGLYKGKPVTVVTEAYATRDQDMTGFMRGKKVAAASKLGVTMLKGGGRHQAHSITVNPHGVEANNAALPRWIPWSFRRGSDQFSTRWQDRAIAPGR